MSPDYSSPEFTNAPTREELTTGADMGRSNFRTSVIQLDRPGDPSVFDEKTRAEAAAIIARYPAGQGRSALGPMLHLVQSVQGQVTPDGIAFCAEQVGLTKAQVSAFATFYTMYKRTPTGEYLVSVCTNTLCAMLGGDEIFAALKKDLKVGNNQTTADGSITLEHAECLAACDYAPVVTVNYEFFDNQTVGSARDLASQLRGGERPLPSRGAPLCSFKEISRQIAGFFDDENAVAAEANSTGVPTERGVKLAIERGDTAPSYAASDGSDTAKPRKRAPAKRQTSAHDAPLKTAESDEATSTEPGDDTKGGLW
ncbi:MAG TPA: NADH-quinone oxidoreductase subunit NuoE [Jatrophihabitans sp.]|jgi:NADH-quinone oxidoreductase subunit E